jgi:hypothetical protein
MTTTQTKFADIEAAIRRQQQSIKQHQEELMNINARTLTTLSLVQATAEDVLQLTENTTRQLTELRDEIRREAAAQAEAQQIGFANMTALFHSLTRRTTTPPTTQFDPPCTQPAIATAKSSDSDDDEEDSDVLIDDMSTETVETDNQSSAYAKSPEKKRNKRKARDPSLTSIRRSLLSKQSQHDQESSAQYNSDSTPDAGET